MPIGLSSTTQPWISYFSRLNCCALPARRGRSTGGDGSGADGGTPSTTIGPSVAASTGRGSAMMELIPARLSRYRDHVLPVGTAAAVRLARLLQSAHRCESGCQAQI